MTAPRVSVIIPAFNALLLTQQCLSSIQLATDQPHEILLVDNASTDGTGRFPWPKPVQVITNETNRGFAAACNQGMRVALGDVFVLLNNDTMVPPGWLRMLLGHLEDPAVGIVGPTLSRAGGVQEVRATYENFAEFWAVAVARAAPDSGQGETVPLLSGACWMLRAETVRAVGLLDERFVPGMFEDNDYCLRVRMAGDTLRWAKDVYVHHEALQGFRQLADPYQAILERNQARFREKWDLGRYGI